MSLTYLGPTIGAGDMIVPAAAAAEAGGDPLLDEAVLLLRSSEWSGSGDWLNEGTAGSALDATVSTSEGPVITSAVVPTSELLAIPVDAEVTWFAQFTVQTPTASDGAALYASGLGVSILESGADGLLGGEFIGGAITTGGFVMAGMTGGGVLAAGTHLLVVTVDRGVEEMVCWIDGTEGATVGDTTGLPAITEAGAYLPQPPSLVPFLAFGVFDRVLTDTEITVDIPAALD